MERTEVFAKLSEIFKDVLDLNGAPNLTDSTCSDDIEGWDSLAQVQLVSVIQKAFDIKFTAREMISWDNVGQMVDSILGKLKC